ncbi:MAG TPA: transcriptional regulator [Streptosporangiaceae bacterium]
MRGTRQRAPGTVDRDFATIAEISELTPATLSKAATALENAGYVRIRKGHIGRRPRTWLSLTKAGRSAFEGHLAALSHLTEQGQSAAGRP